MANSPADRSALVAMSGLAPLLLASLLVPMREHIANTDTALVLVLVVVVAGATAGRRGGALSAATAAMAFDFFHTHPYLSLKITRAADVETTALLLLIGLAAGQAGALSHRRQMEVSEGRVEVDGFCRIAAQAAGATDFDDLVTSVRAELLKLLPLAACEFSPGPVAAGVPVLEKGGWTAGPTVQRFAQDGFELPSEGVALLVRVRGNPVAHLLCIPIPGVGVTLERRRVAVAAADVLGVALAGAPAQNRSGRGTP